MAKRTLSLALGLALIAGCAGVTNEYTSFGPYASSSVGLGSLAAGVAGFDKGQSLESGEQRFRLIVANAEPSTPYDATLESNENGTIETSTLRLVPCGADYVEFLCRVTTVNITVKANNETATYTLSNSPDQCQDRIVWITRAWRVPGGNPRDTRLVVSEAAPQPGLMPCPLLLQAVQLLQ